MTGEERARRAASKARHLLEQGTAKLSRLRREERGTVVVLAAVMFPVIIGGMGLAAETGYWHWTQRKIQHAADVAVHAAGIRMLQGEDDEDELKKVAQEVAEKAGFNGTVALNTPYGGSSDQIEVIATETPPRLFSAVLLGKGDVEIGGRAVVLVEYGQTACVLALSQTASEAVSLGGSSQVILNGCDVASNSTADDSFSLGGTAKLITGCVHSAGGAEYTAGLVLKPEDETSPCSDGEPNVYTRSTRDPYADVLEPDYSGMSCSNDKDIGKNNGMTTLNPSHTLPNGVKAMCFGKGLHVKGDVKFNDGLYIITGGDFVLNASHNVTGKNVTFYLGEGASLSFNGAANADLSAPTTGPYAGLLFFGQRKVDMKTSHLLNGDASGKFTGAVYFPGGQVDYRGSGSSGGGCIQIIGNRVTFGGGATVESNCTQATHGTTNISANGGVTFIE